MKSITRPRWVRAAALVLALTLALGSAPLAAAGSLQDELQKAQNNLKKLESEARAAQAMLKELENKAYAAQISYNRARTELEAAKRKQLETERNLAQAQVELLQIEEELAQIRERLAGRQQRMATRMQSLYVNGRVTYLEVLLGSTSFRDFLSRFRLLQTVVKNDSTLLRAIKADQALAEQKRADAEAHRNQMAALAAQAKEYREQAEAKVAEVAHYKQDLTEKQQQYRRALKQLEDESKRLEKMIKDLEIRIAQEMGQIVLSPPVKPPRRTSSFGMRWHPILREYRMHNGVDYAASLGQNVYAAADGTVLVAGWQGGYGNVVIISHGKVKGKAVSTLYAHNSRLKVHAGQKVRRGDVVALAGTIGLSTGVHVHFEVRVDGVPVDPLKWLSK